MDGKTARTGNSPTPVAPDQATDPPVATAGPASVFTSTSGRRTSARAVRSESASARGGTSPGTQRAAGVDRGMESRGPRLADMGAVNPGVGRGAGRQVVQHRIRHRAPRGQPRGEVTPIRREGTPGPILRAALGRDGDRVLCLTG